MVNLSTLRILANSDRHVFAEAIKKYGLQVIGIRSRNPLDTRVQAESIASMASILTEDVDDRADLSSDAKQVMRIAEEYGYIVKVLEEMGLPGMGGAPTIAPPKPGSRPIPGPARPAPGKQPKRKPFNPPRPQQEPAPKACGGM